jgi:hypothetical protein
MGLDDLLEQTDLVVGVEDREAGFEAGELGMAPEDLDADGMKSAEPGHALDHAADQMADPLLHLARRLVGEGDAEDLAGPGAAGGEDVGETGRQNASLAGTGARQHE